MWVWNVRGVRNVGVGYVGSEGVASVGSVGVG